VDFQLKEVLSARWFDDEPRMVDRHGVDAKKKGFEG